MAWIESHQALGPHPKTFRLAQLLKVSRPVAVGHLHYLWWWALDYASSGDISGFTNEELAGAALWLDDAAKFIQALEKSGFIDARKSKRRLHDWDSYAGRLVRARAMNAARMRDARAAHVQRTFTARAPATVPNPTVPNPTVPNRTPPPTPSGGNGERKPRWKRPEPNRTPDVAVGRGDGRHSLEYRDETERDIGRKLIAEGMSESEIERQILAHRENPES